MLFNKKMSKNIDKCRGFNIDGLSLTVLQNKTFLQTSIRNSHLRFFSSLTHVDDGGKAQMVDVGDKMETARTAVAEAVVHIGKEASELIRQNLIKKGDVLTVAQIAGIMGAKRTSELIPLCHNIGLSQAKLDVKLDIEACNVMINAFVKCKGKTGVEMEALTGVTIAALTVYDMCKAVNKGIVIKNIRLLEKTGGKSKDYRNNSLHI